MIQLQSTTAKRVRWIDYAKGIAILATILGHTVEFGVNGSHVRGLIFSFHMPLFFILSMVTYRCSESMEEFRAKTKKAFRHLIIPAIVVFVILVILECVKNPQVITSLGYWREKLYTFVYASGVETGYSGVNVGAIGMIWFFFALFIGRTIFDYLHLKIQNDTCLFILSCISCMFGIILGQIQWLPFSMDIALAIMPFFFWGYHMKKMDVTDRPWKKFLFWGIVWIALYLLGEPNYEIRSYLELACRRYTLFPLCFVAAIAGTMMISEASVICDRFHILSKPMTYLGRNSLYMLCVHAIDTYWSFLWYVEGHQFVSAAKRELTDLAAFVIVMLVMFLYKKVKQRLTATKQRNV